MVTLNQIHYLKYIASDDLGSTFLIGAWIAVGALIWKPVLRSDLYDVD